MKRIKPGVTTLDLDVKGEKSVDALGELTKLDQSDVEELVARAFKKVQPALWKKVELDSEGDAFVATSHDRKVIMALARLIEKLIDEGGDDDNDDDDDENTVRTSPRCLLVRDP